jgi:uncharacterized protein YkwD
MRRRIFIGTGIAALGALVPFRSGAAHAAVGEAEIRRLLHRLAAVRRAEGLAALARHPALGDMARLHTMHVAALAQATHLDADGRDPVTRGAAAGYSGQVLGETLAETWDGPRETADLWLAHDGTRAVLLHPTARHVGLFGLRARDGLVWWDLVVGQPPAVSET